MIINDPAVFNNRLRQFLPQGIANLRTLRHDPSSEYLVYVPHTATIKSPILTFIHGLTRNFREQAKTLLSNCELYGIILVAPSFTEEHYDDYQRLGRLGRGQRADLFLIRCLEEITSLTGIDTSQINLFGYSGGAQFAHRFVMAHPHRVASAVIASSGWYSLPDIKIKYPYGIASSRKLPKIIFNPEEFLRIPITVLVGELDVDFKALRSNLQLGVAQGKNRIERARNWVTMMRSAAEAYGIEPCVYLTEVSAVGHSFFEFCEQGKLLERVFNILFESSAQQPKQKNNL